MKNSLQGREHGYMQGAIFVRKMAVVQRTMQTNAPGGISFLELAEYSGIVVFMTLLSLVISQLHL